MDTFPPGIQFRKPWRSYQQRVLTELEQHLDDNHLHVIAAPGSGKTVLGLEVMRRLNHPTLILAPTVAIRDQWVDRFVNLFLDARHGTPDWISKDIRAPRFLTTSTYQGLHTASLLVQTKTRNLGPTPPDATRLSNTSSNWVYKRSSSTRPITCEMNGGSAWPT